MTPTEHQEREARIRAEAKLDGYREAMREILALFAATRPLTAQQDGAFPRRRETARPEALAAARLRQQPLEGPPGVEIPPVTVEAIPPEEIEPFEPEPEFQLRLLTPEERAQRQAESRVREAHLREQQEEERRNRARRWVYFIQEGDSGPVKIGFSRDVARRLGELQRQAKAPLRLLVSFEGTRRDEAALHTRFADHRLFGEWFHPAAELLEHVAALQGRKKTVGAEAHR